MKMAKFTALLLLIVASFAAVWGADARDSKPKTCTKYALTEEIIETRNKMVSLKTKGRAPVCTNVYSFTYVRPGSSMTFNSPVKKWKTPTKINCGLWFWTDDSHKFDVICSSIDIKKDDKMVLFDIDNESDRVSISDAVKKDANFSFKSNNLAIGLEMQVKRRKLSYSCTITTVAKPKLSKTVIVGGKSNGQVTPKVDLIENGKVIPLADLPKGTDSNTAVVYGGKLYSCGGSKTGKECISLDLAASSKTWKTELTLPVSLFFTPLIVVRDDLWIVYYAEVIVVQFKSGTSVKHKFPGSFSVDQYSCAGGDNSLRFFIPNSSVDVWINTDVNKPADWTKKVILNKSGDYKSCMMIGTDLYVTGGRGAKFVPTAQRVDLVTYKTHALADMTVPRTWHATGMVNNQLAVFGGTNGEDISEIEVYNAETNKWTTLPLTLTAGKLQSMGYVTFA